MVQPINPWFGVTTDQDARAPWQVSPRCCSRSRVGIPIRGCACSSAPEVPALAAMDAGLLASQVDEFREVLIGINEDVSPSSARGVFQRTPPLFHPSSSRLLLSRAR